MKFGNTLHERDGGAIESNGDSALTAQLGGSAKARDLPQPSAALASAGTVPPWKIRSVVPRDHQSTQALKRCQEFSEVQDKTCKGRPGEPRCQIWNCRSGRRADGCSLTARGRRGLPR